MASINKVILIGNLGRDPEVRYTANGAAVCNITIATSRNWKDKNSGEKQEETEWHRVVFFDKLAEIAGEYLKKGKSVYVEGRLKTRKWQDKDGNDKYTTEIVADNMQMLGGRDSNADEEEDETPTQQPMKPPAKRVLEKRSTTPAPAPKSSTGFDDMDDIPF